MFMARMGAAGGGRSCSELGVFMLGVAPEQQKSTCIILLMMSDFVPAISPICSFNMAGLEDDDVLDEEHLNAVIQFPPDVQEAIDQVTNPEHYFSFG
jgi:hypothetical protein